MTKRKNKFIIKFLVYLPYLLLLYLLQSTVFTRLTIFGVKPLILPLAVVGTALFKGKVTGGVFGIFAGMLMDLSYNQPTVQFTLILTVTGILFGVLSDTVLVQGYPSYLLCSALQLLICSALQVLSFVVLSGAPLNSLIGTALTQSLVSLIFTVPLYYVTAFLNRVI